MSGRTFSFVSTGALASSRLGDHVIDLARTSAAAVEGAIVSFHAQHGRWPRFAWATSTEADVTGHAGDTPPVGPVVVYDCGALNRLGVGPSPLPIPRCPVSDPKPPIPGITVTTILPSSAPSHELDETESSAPRCALTQDEVLALEAIVLSMDVGETRQEPLPGIASVKRTGSRSATVQLPVAARVFSFPIYASVRGGDDV